MSSDSNWAKKETRQNFLAKLPEKLSVTSQYPSKYARHFDFLTISSIYKKYFIFLFWTFIFLFWTFLFPFWTFLFPFWTFLFPFWIFLFHFEFSYSHFELSYSILNFLILNLNFLILILNLKWYTTTKFAKQHIVSIPQTTCMTS